MGPRDHECKSISEVNPRIASQGFNNSIYKTITYSYIYLHARLWVHGAMSALNFLTVYLKKITMVTGDTNEKYYLYQRLSIALQRDNAACVQCCFCNEDDPLE